MHLLSGTHRNSSGLMATGPMSPARGFVMDRHGNRARTPQHKNQSSAAPPE